MQTVYGDGVINRNGTMLAFLSLVKEPKLEFWRKHIELNSDRWVNLLA